ncbi:MAG: hypothetical protein NXI04_06815 [Planctomycetaceae bacterium]|nr:hypothetical protein [Planctomycetaceae bacterium]
MTVPDSHTRLDILTGRPVIMAAAREQRPVPLQDGMTSDAAAKPDSGAAADPFLEGQESHTPDERLALRQTDTRPNMRGWLVRVVPNRYPAVVQATGDSDKPPPQSAHWEPLIGQHDVVVECADFLTQLQQLSVTQLTRVLLAWQLRVLQLHADGRFPHIRIFRNQGVMAGASLPHSHSQIVATALADETAGMPLWRAPLTDSGENRVFLQWKNAELQAETRLLEASAKWLIVCPFAGRFSWHTRVCPGPETPACFERLSVAQLKQLAARLKSICVALPKLAGQVDFNLTLTLPSVGIGSTFPWMLDILPRPGRIAGFELMTGVHIVTVTPETAAARFRETIVWEQVVAAPRDGQSPIDNDVTPVGYHWHPS